MSEPELDEIADELYALHPDAFAAARDERVRQARAEGKPTVARDLARLRRPTMSAWLVNLLWRDQPEVVEQLLGIAEGLARAQAQGSGQALRSLTAQRREVETALIKRAHALAEEAGVKVTQAMVREAQDTLGAAMARPDVAAEVRTGRLVKPATYAGFGDLVMAMPAVHDAAPTAPPPPRVVPAPTPARLSKPDDQANKAVQPAKVDERAARAAQREAERRQEAERRLQNARTALEAAAGALADETRAAESAQRHHDELRAEVEQLRERLRALEQERAAAESAARIAAQRRDRAEKAHEVARQAVERAERDAADPTKDS